MNPGDLFLRPAWALLLLLLPLLWWAMRRSEARRLARLHAVIGPRLAVLAPGLSPRLAHLRQLLFLGGSALLVLALAAPTWGEEGVRLNSQGAAIMVVLDVSRSMLAEDAAPNRLGRAREEIADLVNAVRADRLGLVVFAGEARLMCPLTRDHRAFLDLLRMAGPSELRSGGTDLEAAIERAALALRELDLPERRIYLLTDGEDHEGRGRAAAARAFGAGIEVHAIGVGSELGARVPLDSGTPRGPRFLLDEKGEEVLTRMDRRSLAALAKAGGGRFQDALPGSLVRLDSELRGRFGAGTSKAAADERPDRYRWPLLLALLFLALEFGLVDRRRS